MESISGYLKVMSFLPEIRAASNEETIVPILSELFDKIGIFDVLFFAWPDGSAIRSVNTSFDVKDREYFQKVVATKKSYVSDVLISKSTGQPSVVVCEPVMDGDRMVGILGVTYGLERLTPIMEKVTFADTGYGFIADKTGLVISNPKYAGTVGKLNIGESNVNADAKLKESTLSQSLIDIYKKASSAWDRPIFGNFSFEGEDCEGIFEPINLPGGQKWLIAVTAPSKEVERDVRTLSRVMALLSAVFVVIGLLFVVFISRRVAKPISLIRDECLMLASGDLRERTVGVKSADETGQLAEGFVDMKKYLHELIKNVISKADGLTHSSEALTANSRRCSEVAADVSRAMSGIKDGANKQTDSTANIFGIANGISEIAQNVLEVTRHVGEIALTAADEAKQGQTSVGRAMEQMKEISEGSVAVQSAIVELSSDSKEIAEIVNLISSVAQQTNLLALNAAIEAARAGEHGRGFAVVAEEVRKLAESSSGAAQKIAALIENNQKNMEQAITATKASEEGVTAGIGVVNTAGQIFAEIAASSVSLSESINGISSSMEKIADGNRELVASIGEIEKIGRKNIGEVDRVETSADQQIESIRQISESSDDLAVLAEDLRMAADSFKI
jgi:methyl-accepting chemotaxis protein